MGKAPVELPDPQELSSSPPGANADDLLSQMAGAEIDRLLADADLAEDPAPSPEPFNPIEEPAIAPSPPTIAPTADNIPADAPEDAAPPADPQAARSPTDEILDAFATADVPETSTDEAPLQSAIIDVAGDGSAITDSLPPIDQSHDQPDPYQSADRVAALAVDETNAIDDDDWQEASSPAERTLLGSPPPQQAMPPRPAPQPIPAEPPLRVDPEELLDDGDAPPSAAKLLAEELDSPSLVRILSESPGPQDLLNDAGPPAPLLLKPLVWLNAPFASLQPKTRDLLGKVGVWTLLHAAAVLAYVVIFRK